MNRQAWADLARRYRGLAADARAEAATADQHGLDDTVWRSLAATWDDAAQEALARRFADECTCPQHRAARQAAARQ